MIDILSFREMTSDILDELPMEFYKELNGGIIAEDYAKNSPYGEDLFIMGEYCINNCGRMIKLYYGSFERLYGNLPEDLLKIKIRETVRHEFTHHLEHLGGERGLEIEDEQKLREYLSRK